MRDKSIKMLASDFILALLASAALSYNLFNAFIIPLAQRTNVPTLLLTCAVALLIANVCFYNRYSTIASLVLAGGFLALGAAYVFFLSNPLRLIALLPFLFYLVAAGCCLLVFFGMKTKAGILILFLSGAGYEFYLAFVGFDLSYFAYFLFLLIVALLFMRRLFQNGIRSGFAEKRISPVYTAIISGVAVSALILSQFIYNVGLRLPAQSGMDVRDVFKFNTQRGGSASAGYIGSSENQLLGERVRPDNTLVLRVKASSPFYIVGRTYDSYSNNTWSSTLFEQSVEDWNRMIWMPGYAYDNNRPLFDQAGCFGEFDGTSYFSYYQNTKTDISIKTLQVTYAADGFHSLFLPSKYIFYRSTGDFMLSPPSNGSYAQISDIPVGASYSVTYADMDPSLNEIQHILVNDKDIFSNMMAADRNPNTAQAQLFDSEMRRHYVTLDASVTPRTIALAKSITKSCTNDYSKVQAIRDYLSDHYQYRLSPKQPPKGKDFVDYFLFQGKSGYCVHFATAMTVLLRAAGVPARYVEGFVSPPVASNGVYKVTNNQAHAWVQVYSSSLGFYTVEATPGFEYTQSSVMATGAGASSEENSDTKRGHSSSDDSSSAVQSSSAPSAGETDTNAHNRSLLPLVPLCILLLFALLLLVKKIWRTFCLFRIERLEAHSRVKKLYAYYLKTLSRLGLARKPAETPMEYARRIEGTIRFGSYDFHTVTEMFCRVRYGSEPFCDEDAALLKTFTHDFLHHCRKYAGIPRYLLAYLLI